MLIHTISPDVAQYYKDGLEAKREVRWHGRAYTVESVKPGRFPGEWDIELKPL